jgi:hypothetical protein
LVPPGLKNPISFGFFRIILAILFPIARIGLTPLLLTTYLVGLMSDN